VDFIDELCSVLKKGNFLRLEEIKGDKGTVTGFQLRSDKIIWKIGNGETSGSDKVRVSSYRTVELKPNSFFKELYAYDFTAYKKQIIGREHTGQLNTQDSEISALFCSPTMELGIDIADLNIVHMRNVPPNPANYGTKRTDGTGVYLLLCMVTPR